MPSGRDIGRVLWPLVERIRARPKHAAVVVALILLVPVLLTGGQVIGLGGAPAGPGVVFAKSTLLSGSLNRLELRFIDPQSVVELPRGFLLVLNGQLSLQPTVGSGDVADGSLTLLVPPVLGTFTFSIESTKGRWVKPVQVLAGPTPVVSGQDTVSNLEYLTQAFQLRFSGSPKLRAAADHFYSTFAGLGLDAEMYFYPWEVERRPLPLRTFINLIVVCGFQRGTQAAGEWIVLGAHMDSVPQAIEGAYDDGSGTSALLEVAEGLSQFKTRHTIVYCLWGGEEEGLYGSNHWVANEVTGRVRLYVNMDMAGLSWPAPFNFTAFVGPDREEGVAEHPGLVAALENITDGELRYPREGNFSILEDPFGRSDHVSFWSLDAPTVFFFGADDIEYPEYHSQEDTLATMERHAGSRDMLVAGFDTLVWEAFYLAVHADLEELK